MTAFEEYKPESIEGNDSHLFKRHFYNRVFHLEGLPQVQPPHSFRNITRPTSNPNQLNASIRPIILTLPSIFY